MSTTFPGLQSIMQAIAREENVNPVYNNPGAITDSSGALIQYPDLQTGTQAFQNQITRALSGNSPYYSPNMSINEFENTYTGGDPNAGKNVASFLGVPPTTSIGNVANSQPSSNPSQPSSAGTGIAGLPTWAQSIINNANAAFGNNAIAAGIQNLTGSTSSGTKIPFIGVTVVDIVAVVAGLVLLAGAIFGFKNVQETVVGAAKRGAEVAAL